MTVKPIVERIEEAFDLSVGTLNSGGGKLDPIQVDSFFQRPIQSTGILGRVRRVPMEADTMKLPKIALGNPITRAAAAGTPPFAADNGTNSRYLAAAQRFTPAFEQIQMVVQEYQAEIHLTDDIMENNIEGEALRGIILGMAQNRILNDLEFMLLNSDAPSATHPNAGFQDALRLQDGVMKRITSNIVNAGAGQVTPTLMRNIKRAVPDIYQADINNMELFAHYNVVADYQAAVAARQTNLGDAALLSNVQARVLNQNLVGLNTIPVANGLFINPNNIIMGYQRDMRLETDRDIRARANVFVWTYKVAFQVEEELAAVRVNNLVLAA